MVKNLLVIPETRVDPSRQEIPWRGMAPHSIILAWRSHGKKEPERATVMVMKESDTTGD